MPQLNPAPWFTIMAFSWLVFLTIIPPKVISHTFPNETAAQSSDVLKAQPWTWPWS
nr:ATP synthase F0 subunit 8 [Synodus binotatus]